MWFATAACASFDRRRLRGDWMSVGTAAFLALAVIVGAPPAFCGDAPIADGGDWQPVNQVLEIPQACTRDGVVISCDESASSTGEVPDKNTAGGDTTAGTETASTGGGARTDGDYNVPEITPDWGSVDDYENQEIEEVPVYVGVPVGPRVPALGAPHVGPTTPTLTPAWARPPFGSGPWMLPPSSTMMPAAPAPLGIAHSPFPLH